MINLKNEFYFAQEVNDVHDLGPKRGGLDLVRESIFIRLMTFCSTGAKVWNYKSLSFQNNPNQTKLVWDYCVSEGILKETDSGYSAIDWLKERQMLSLETFQNLPSNAPKRGRPPKHTSEPKAPPKVGQISQANGIDEQGSQADVKDVPKENEKPKDNPLSSTDDHDEHQQTDNHADVKVESITDTVPLAAPIQQAAPIPLATQEETQIPTQNDCQRAEVKERVRPNVFLTRSEINDLKSRFTDSQITLMLDKLSEYKSETKRYYASDFDAIERWVIKWLNTTNNQSQKKASIYDEPFEVPSWLTGR